MKQDIRDNQEVTNQVETVTKPAQKKGFKRNFVKKDRENHSSKDDSNNPAGNLAAWPVTQAVVYPVIRTDVQYDVDQSIAIETLPLEWIAQTITDGISAVRYGRVSVPGLTNEIEEVEQYIKDAMIVPLIARICAVNNYRFTNEKPSQFEYVAIVAPILGKIGIFENGKGYRITPKMDEALINKGKDVGCLEEFTNKEGKVEFLFKVPDWYTRMMTFFRTNQMMTGIALPRSRYTDSEMLYQLVIANNNIIGANTEASAEDVIISMFLKAAALTEVYGQYRVIYGAITSMRSAIEQIALASLHKLLNR